MNVAHIGNSCSFGKSAIFHCTVKRNGTNKKEGATLYEFDKSDLDDINEIKNSNLSPRLRINFTTPNKAESRRFYGLQTDDKNEFVSFAQTSRHFNVCEESKYFGINTVIDEYSQNSDFVDPQTPMLAHIVSTAMDKGDKFVMTAFRAEEEPSFKKASFSESKYENWVIPEKRYLGLIDKAEKRGQIEYLI